MADYGHAVCRISAFHQLILRLFHRAPLCGLRPNNIMNAGHKVALLVTLITQACATQPMPSGHLYALAMETIDANMSASAWTSFLAELERQGFLTVRNHLVTLTDSGLALAAQIDATIKKHEAAEAFKPA